MLRIGLIGESEYDREALKNLLGRYYGEKLQFSPLLKRVRGTQLDQEKTRDLLEEELKGKKLDLLIIQRDLDAAETDESKLNERKAFFNGMCSRTSSPGFFLLHIQTLEALILADLDGFNKRFKVSASFTGNPMHQEKPKRWLRDKSKKDAYEAKHSPELFAELDIDKLRNRVRYFNTFIVEFEELLKKTA